MTNVNGIQPPVAPRAIEPVGSAAGAGRMAQTNGISDVVDLSNVSRLAQKVREIPDVRADLVARVKAEIAAGTYETPERLEIAVDRLMEELLG